MTLTLVNDIDFTTSPIGIVDITDKIINAKQPFF